ncbi:60S ribosomal protein L32-like [Lutra lutra]|uniref:60S ribosomal protein L32-like n=1 Tax=Lutra lutra TaxID=9657 RepID=UPI001FCF97CD|nr:60S ribosomal protein L32-like [Lutra lutra]
MTVLRPLVEPNIIKEKAKKFIRHQSDRYVKLSATVRDPEALRAWCEEIQEPELHALRRFWHQQGNKVKCAQWHPEVPSAQRQGARVRLMCNKFPCAGIAVVERAAQRP